MIFYEPGHRDRSVLPHNPFKSLVAPRPIGWISTMDSAGRVNLAPYSFFNAVAEGPEMLAFSSTGAKDSATFAGELREFVWNLVTWELREQMNESSAPLPRGSSEFDRAGLEMAPSRLVAPPRVAASPCAMECKVVHHLELRDLQGRGFDTTSSSARSSVYTWTSGRSPAPGSTPRDCARSRAAAGRPTTPWSSGSSR
jgi:flavin reductase (DIM6/NTAB) family NADH-FMN oxidoreductase RutF